METARAKGKWQGMNWIRQEKRLAIYLRDGLACGWCGAKVEDGARFTLDHLKPHHHGGSNHETNLITACERCNSSRGTRSLKRFAAAVAVYLNHGIEAAAILASIRAKIARPLNLTEAKQIIARRGSAFAALASRASGVRG
jgi:hypothetical protein